MAVQLSKGGNISLSKEAPGLTHLLVGLGWNESPLEDEEFDLDASAFMLAANGRVRSDADFIFYNQLCSVEGSVEHLGDNRTGGDGGDDEQLVIQLDNVPDAVQKIVITVTIHEAEQRMQNFGQVSGAYIRCVNQDNDTEIAKYDLSEDASIETAMIFGEIYRYNCDWKFRAVGQGFTGGLAFMAKKFGVNVA